MKNLGAWGTLIHEKNLKSKISFQSPFKKIKMKVFILLGHLSPFLWRFRLLYIHLASEVERGGGGVDKSKEERMQGKLSLRTIPWESWKLCGIF